MRHVVVDRFLTLLCHCRWRTGERRGFAEGAVLIVDIGGAVTGAEGRGRCQH